MKQNDPKTPIGPDSADAARDGVTVGKMIHYLISAFFLVGGFVITNTFIRSDGLYTPEGIFSTLLFTVAGGLYLGYLIVVKNRAK